MQVLHKIDWICILQAGPAILGYFAWLKQINSYSNVQTFIATAKSALDANMNLDILYYTKCKVMHIDIFNSVTNIKYKVHCINSACKCIFLCPDSQTVSTPILLLHPKLQDNEMLVKHPYAKIVGKTYVKAIKMCFKNQVIWWIEAQSIEQT